MMKTRSTTFWSKHNIPDEIWREILSKLPVKSLLRFRSVSKTWLSFIDDPAFARYHLTRFNNNLHQSHLFILHTTTTTTSHVDCVVRCSTTFRSTAKNGALNSLQLPVKNLRNLLGRPIDLQTWTIVGSIDGLFMLKNTDFNLPHHILLRYPSILEDSKHELMLWNPSIRKVRILPPPHQTYPPPASLDVGLGFDPSINDYKHVRFAFDSKGAQLSVSVVIYTVGADSWKVISFDKFSYFLRFLPGRVCFRGALYFLLSKPSSFDVYSFHLRSEVFASATLPNAGHSFLDGYPMLTLADGGASLAVVFITSNQGSIWVSEGFGGDGTQPISWRIRYTFASRIPDEYPNYGGRISLVCLKKNGEMILEWGGGRLVTYYNLKTRTEKVMLKNNAIGMNISGAYVHFENLMLLN